MAVTDKTEKTTQAAQPTQPPPSPGAARAPQPGAQSSLTRPRREPLDLHAARAFGPLWLMRRLFESFDAMAGLGRIDEQGPRGIGMFMPEIDISRRGDRLVVQADLPGLARDDVRVSIDNGMLMIEGERRSAHERHGGDVWTCERSYGRFQRAIPLPETADPNTADARFENGVLEISIRAPESQSRGRQIEVKGGSQPQGAPPVPGSSAR